MNIGIIGAGKMGEMIIQGLLNSSSDRSFTVQASTRSTSAAQEISQRLSVDCHTDNKKVITQSDVVIICTKPHQVETLLTPYRSVFKSSQLLISVCAGISCQQLEKWAGGKVAVVRTMPNTPCMIGEGMTVLCSGTKTSEAQMQIADTVFRPLGKTVRIEESLMDGATGLSGCGPAYVYMIIEALSEAGVKVGLPRQTATLMAAQTLAGAAQMVLQRGIHPAALKDEVTTPAGCTIDGLMALEEGKLRVTLVKAVLAASKRSQQLRL